jgi:hypothetical protein
MKLVDSLLESESESESKFDVIDISSPQTALQEIIEFGNPVFIYPTRVEEYRVLSRGAISQEVVDRVFEDSVNY